MADLVVDRLARGAARDTRRGVLAALGSALLTIIAAPPVMQAAHRPRRGPKAHAQSARHPARRARGQAQADQHKSPARGAAKRKSKGKSKPKKLSPPPGQTPPPPPTVPPPSPPSPPPPP